jgi:predicted acetyltransferase
MPRRNSKPRPPVTLAEVNRRIAELRTHGVPTRSDPEPLDTPLDPDIRVVPRGYQGGDAHAIELLIDGEAVSWLTVIDFRQQVGGSLLRMGGIAGVGTHDAHRFRGYSRRVIGNALRWMRREGFDVSMLFGIRSFYPKYGFAEAFPDTSFSIATRDAESAGGDGRSAVARWTEFDADAHQSFVVRVHALHDAGRTGPIVRDPQRWNPFRKGLQFGTQAAARVALDRRGKPCAYLATHREHLTATVLEAGVAAPAGWHDVLREAARLALEQRLEQVRFVMPEDHALAQFARPLGTRVESIYRPDGGAMIRLINVATTLTKLAPTLAERVRGNGALSLRTNAGGAALTRAAGHISVADRRAGGPVATLPQWALAQLIYGYRDAASLAEQGVLRAPRAAVETLGRLFPPHPHFFYSVDQF